MRYESEVKGKAKQVKGTAKEKLGELTDDRALQDEGTRERSEGEVQEKVGKARRVISDTVEDIGEEIASG